MTQTSALVLSPTAILPTLCKATGWPLLCSHPEGVCAQCPHSLDSFFSFVPLMWSSFWNSENSAPRYISGRITKKITAIYKYISRANRNYLIRKSSICLRWPFEYSLLNIWFASLQNTIFFVCVLEESLRNRVESTSKRVKDDFAWIKIEVKKKLERQPSL